MRQFSRKLGRTEFAFGQTEQVRPKTGTPQVPAAQTIRLLVDGQESFDRILRGIRSASQRIEVGMFIWRDDATGRSVASELLEAAARGVHVQISKDRLGVVFEKSEENKKSFFHHKESTYLWSRRRALQWLYFGWGSSSPRSHESLGLMSKLLNHPKVEADLTVKHDHSKYYVFDDTRLILGGINIEDKGAGFDLRNKCWRDYMVEVTGTNLVRAFLARESSPIRLNRGLSAQFVFNDPKGSVSRIRRLVMRLLSEARESVVIEMAYFGDRVLAKKIIQTVNRGINVTIVSAEHPNVQQDLNRKVLRDIVAQTRGRVRLYLSPDMIHSKMVCVDNKAFLVGSANFNRQSPLTGEAALLLRGQLPEFEAKIQESIGRNLDNSWQVTHASDLDYSRVRAFVESFFC